MSSRPRAVPAALLTALVAGLVGLPAAPASAAPPTTPFISEIHYDNDGTDAGEFVEVQLPAGTSSNGLSVVLYNGNNNAVYDTDALPAVTAPADAPAVAVVSYPANGIQNGSPDGVALVRDGQVLEFLSYEGAMTAASGPASGMTSTDIGVSEAGTEPAGQSLSRTYDAATDALVWAGPAEATPGAVNGSRTEEPDPEPTDPASVEPTRISAIQGSGASSPIVGQQVVVEAVVTSLITSSDKLDGFFVQEEDAHVDDSTATSEGVYVFCRAACPSGLAAGELVRVDGRVAEFNGSTQVDMTAGSIERVAAAQPLPTAAEVTLPASSSTRDAATFEPVEGMRTTLPTTLVVSEYFNLARYGELVLTAQERPYQFTQRSTPSEEGYATHLAELAKRRIVLDDDSNDQNDATSGPSSNEPYYYPTGGLSTENRFRGGDTITGLTGVFEYSFGAWKLRPVSDEDYVFTPANPRPAAPDEVGGRLTVASFNVLNYFATIDETSSNDSGACAPSGTADCRGADSEAERQRQLAKVVAALEGLDADVVGLIEIQNDEGQATQQIVDALNAATAPGTYDYIRTGTIGTDAIKQAFLYKPAAVQPVGSFALLTTAQDERFVDTRNRPALIQTFEEVGTGERVTVAVNHFKSKGSGCGEGDDSPADGSGNCDGTRLAAAQALADHLATDPTGSGDRDSLIIGDLNSYREERPITALEEAGYVNLLQRFEGEDSYGYVFDGQLGDLDHALASASLDRQVTGAGGWKINADEPPLLDYNDTVKDAGEASLERESFARELYAPDPYRSSDHDPAIVGLDLQGRVVGPVPVQVLGINDFHGHLDPARSGPSVAGRLAGAVDGFREQVPSTAFVSAGDNIGASPFLSSVAKDEPAIDVLNATGLDVSAVGNHEYDRGNDDLEGRVSERAAFPFLAANVEGTDLPGSHVLTTTDGVRLGFIGVVTEQTASLVSPSGIEGLTFTDPTEAANREAALLSDGDEANGEADVIVLLAHEGAAQAATTPEQCATVFDAEDAFGEILRGTSSTVDVILGGHTHVRVDCEFPNPGGKGATRPVLEAAEYGKALDRLTFTYDTTTDTIRDVDGAVVELTAAAFPGTDERVEEIVREAQARADELGSPGSARSPRTSSAPSRRPAARTAARSPSSATSSPTCSSTRSASPTGAGRRSRS